MEKSNYHSNADHHKRHMKRSMEERVFLYAFVISFIACALFLGWRLASVLETTRVPPIPTTHTSSNTDVMENLGEGALATAKEQGDGQEWSLILMSRQNPISAQYDAELEQLSNGERINIRISPHLQDLFDAARTDGVCPTVTSGCRITEEQQGITSEKIAEYKTKGHASAQTKAETETWVVMPGMSEHRPGLTVDINANGIHSTGNEVYGWLDENSYHFGLIRRYLLDKTEITSVSNEPWYHRYTGVETATEMYNQGVYLEEYLEPGK